MESTTEISKSVRRVHCLQYSALYVIVFVFEEYHFCSGALQGFSDGLRCLELWPRYFPGHKVVLNPKTRLICVFYLGTLNFIVCCPTSWKTLCQVC